MIHFPKTANPEIEAWLAHQRELASGKYDSDEILEQLAKDFHNKCYICEDSVKSIRIEHFRPKKLGKKQEFDWYNLFNSCDHCNAIKSDDYLRLIDCTKVLPDIHIKFEVEPMNPIGEQVVLTQLEGSAISKDTINLLNAVYKGTNKRKQLEAQNIVKDLVEEINDFKDLVAGYISDRDEDDLEDIRYEVNNESKFTAFKRWVVRNNPDFNQEFSTLFVN